MRRFVATRAAMLALLAFAPASRASEGLVRNLAARQRYPWNGLVDIAFTVEGDATAYAVSISAADATTGESVPVRTAYPRGGAPGDSLRFAPGVCHIVWDAGADAPERVIESLSLTLRAFGVEAGQPLYLVIDLSGGASASSYPVEELQAEPPGGFNVDEYKTTKLVLRRIDPGMFTAGSPSGEVGRYPDEDRREVTLTQPFYIGVFEVTQRQWELVMGTRPSYFFHRSYGKRPVEQVSYNDIRGASTGSQWPASGAVDAASFLGRLRARASAGGAMAWDLPTEAQWEYACRAGTTTALNSGENLASAEQDASMAELGRHYYNGGQAYDEFGDFTTGTAEVGSFLPNDWGLYDMHGNVWEWCLDWWQPSPGAEPVTDPAGAPSGDYRALRGGAWFSNARACRSANREGNSDPATAYSNCGFRLARVVLP